MELKIKIDGRSKDGRTLLNYLQNLSYVKILSASKEEYDEEFVAEILKRAESDDLTTIKDTSNIWESIL